ncbi:MAG: type II toxin-antitoxin system RelE/ParE family toxin [bacterium]
MIYSKKKVKERKPIGWLSGEIKTPPFSSGARVEAGYLLCRLQNGDLLPLPHSRPMPGVGSHCHELRVKDAHAEWRIIYRVDSDVILVVAVFEKKTRETPQHIMDVCRYRLRQYDEIAGG